MNRKVPWGSCAGEEIQRRVCAGERPPLPAEEHNKVKVVVNSLVVACWAQNLGHRPHFKEIRSRLDAIQFDALLS